MEIKALVLGDIEVNCYLVSTEKAAVVIDPGFRSDEALEFLQNAKGKERLIMLTHGHFDHIGFADELASLTDTKIAIGEFDAQDSLLCRYEEQMRAVFKRDGYMIGNAILFPKGICHSDRKSVV